MTRNRSFTVGAEHPCLRGHFPGAPVVPGVLILEEVMRAISGVAFPAKWSKVKFIRPVFPDERVDIHWDAGPAKIGFECRVAGRVVVMGTVEPSMDRSV